MTLIIGNKIAQGNNAIVYECGDNVVKVIDQITTQRSKLNNEIKVLLLLRENPHPNMVKVIDIIEEGDKVYVLMERLGKNLYDFLPKRISPSQAKEYMLGIIQGLAHLHSLGWFHGDLKLENVVVDLDLTPFGVKLIDFGFSIPTSETINNSGTPDYIAPEMLTKSEYSEKSEVWQLGIILYELIYMKAPFEGLTVRQIARNIRRKEPAFDDDPSLSDVNAVIRRALEKDPENRPTLKEFSDLVNSL